MALKELTAAFKEAFQASQNKEIKEKSKRMHGLLDKIAVKKGYLLKLRK